MSRHPPRNPLDTPLLEAMAASIASDLIDGAVHVLDRRDLAVRAARKGIPQTIDLARWALEEMAADHEHAGEAAKAVILSAPSSLPGMVESGPRLTRTLVLRSGERLKTLRHATEMMGRLVGNARHSASLERAITLLLRAAEAETRDDRKAATNQVAGVLRLNGLLQRTGGVRAVPTPPTGR